MSSSSSSSLLSLSPHSSECLPRRTHHQTETASSSRSSFSISLASFLPHAPFCAPFHPVSLLDERVRGENETSEQGPWSSGILPLVDGVGFLTPTHVNIVREWCDAADMARKRVMDVALAIQSPRRLDSSIIDACRSYLQIIQWMRVHIMQSSWLQCILSHKDTWKKARGNHREEEEENNSGSQVPFRFRWILSPLLHGSDIICQDFGTIEEEEGLVLLVWSSIRMGLIASMRFSNDPTRVDWKNLARDYQECASLCSAAKQFFSHHSADSIVKCRAVVLENMLLGCATLCVCERGRETAIQRSTLLSLFAGAAQFFQSAISSCTDLRDVYHEILFLRELCDAVIWILCSMDSFANGKFGESLSRLQSASTSSLHLEQLTPSLHVSYHQIASSFRKEIEKMRVFLLELNTTVYHDEVPVVVLLSELLKNISPSIIAKTVPLSTLDSSLADISSLAEQIPFSRIQEFPDTETMEAVVTGLDHIHQIADLIGSESSQLDQEGNEALSLLQLPGSIAPYMQLLSVDSSVPDWLRKSISDIQSKNDIQEIWNRFHLIDDSCLMILDRIQHLCDILDSDVVENEYFVFRYGDASIRSELSSEYLYMDAIQNSLLAFLSGYEKAISLRHFVVENEPLLAFLSSLSEESLQELIDRFRIEENFSRLKLSQTSDSSLEEGSHESHVRECLASARKLFCLLEEKWNLERQRRELASATSSWNLKSESLVSILFAKVKSDESKERSSKSIIDEELRPLELLKSNFVETVQREKSLLSSLCETKKNFDIFQQKIPPNMLVGAFPQNPSIQLCCRSVELVKYLDSASRSGMQYILSLLEAVEALKEDVTGFAAARKERRAARSSMYDMIHRPR